MVYRRRFRKKRFRKRSVSRRFKRRVRRRRGGKGRFYQFLDNQKRLNGVRSYTKESRVDDVDSGQNTVKLTAVASMGCYDAIEGIITATGGQDATQLGGGTFAADKTQLKYHLSGYKQIFHLRNLSPHEIFVTLYEVVCKRDKVFSGSATTAGQNAIADIYDGLIEDMGAGSSGVAGGSGDALFSYTSGTDSMTMDTRFISIKRSRFFNENWYCVKQKQFKLNPGDDVHWNMRIPDRVFNALRWSGGTVKIKKNYTKCLLMKVYGVMGHGTADTGKIGLMKGIVGYDTFIKCRVVPLMGADNNHNHEVVHDDLTGVTLEGPSEEVLTAEGS